MGSTLARTVFAVPTLLALFACSKQERQPIVLTGTVTYRDRLALPNNASIRVTLQDVSRLDVAATMIAETTVVPGGRQVPIPFSLEADARWFTACGTEVRLPVAMEDDNAALERAYSAAPHEPGAPLLVTFLGRIEPREPMEGPSPVDHVIVERFVGVWPEETCKKAGVETPLANTYWKLVELDGAPVLAGKGQKETHMILNLKEKNVSGSGECNRFTGTYAASGDSLSFGPGAATKMACVEMRTESAFFAALEKVGRYEIQGETLVLLGEAGLIARFRAVYL